MFPLAVNAQGQPSLPNVFHLNKTLRCSEKVYRIMIEVAISKAQTG